ncbi:MAG: riboflavin synthase [Dehalococcoidales bacterium]|nr:riboflavin synthase [Dehalococcoidales bacterium]
MFTGIVEELGKITLIQPNKLAVKATRVLEGTELGSSIAVNGVCLTVTAFSTGSFSVDVMPETLRRTNLNLLKAGDEVNLERPMIMGGRLGGHLVQGHIDDTCKVISIRHEQEAILMHFAVPHRLMRYLAVKGFIAVDGLSLTVLELGEDSFTVSLVAFTQQHTTMGKRKVGDIVNVEVDIIAKYVESLTRTSGDGVTFDFLKEHGFITN